MSVPDFSGVVSRRSNLKTAEASSPTLAPAIRSRIKATEFESGRAAGFLDQHASRSVHTVSVMRASSLGRIGLAPLRTTSNTTAISLLISKKGSWPVNIYNMYMNELRCSDREGETACILTSREVIPNAHISDSFVVRELATLPELYISSLRSSTDIQR